MILLNFKFRQHVIYIVLSVIVGLLIKEGVFVLLLVGFVYFKRFPKTYWIYFLISLISMIYIDVALTSLQVKSDDSIYIDKAKVIEVKKQTEEKQTAKVQAESGLYYLTLANSTPRLMPGDWMEVNTEIAEITDPTVPHAFNFKQYLQANGMRGTIYLTSTRVIDQEWSIRAYQFQLANWIKEQYPPLTATYLQSWFLGVRNDLSEEVSDSYATLGIIHLFAVSGLHVGLLAGIVSYLLKRLGVIQELADLMVVTLLFCFMMISGASPSIVRAASMAILAKINSRFKWNLSSLDIFSIVFLINFIVCPLQVYQIGFIYSYWLTFCLIICQSVIKPLSPKVTFFIIPFLAQLAILPIQISQDYSINLLSYVSNLVLIPVVTTLLIPCLLITLVIPPFALITEKILSVFEQVILVAGKYLDLRWVIGSLNLSMVILIILLLFLAGWLVEKNSHSKKWMIVLVSTFVLLEIVRGAKPTSKVTFLDVGQGDSTIIQSPYQRCTIVVDTGGKVSFIGEKTSIFNQTLEPYLLGEGIRTIDYLILSHGDFDHIGEAIPLMETFNVKHLVVPKHSESEQLKDVIKLAKQLNVNVLTPKTNDTLTCGNQTLTFLQPDEKQANENDQSLVLTVEISDLTVLLTGDISTEVEADILSQYPGLKLDVYKAAHHGSNTSNSLFFLEQLAPSISVVSSGKNNRYGHPSQEFLSTLSTLNIPLLNTQVDGTIQFEMKRGKTLVHRFH